MAASDPEKEGGEQPDPEESVAEESDVAEEDAAEEDAAEEDSAEEDREEEDMEQEENEEDLEQVKLPPKLPPKLNPCRSTRLQMQNANPPSSYEPPARTQKQPDGNASRSRPSRTRANLLEVVSVSIDWSV